jgi:hypothetical protein
MAVMTISPLLCGPEKTAPINPGHDMTMLLSPYLPFDPEETVLSWGARLAALHTGGGLVPFLHDLMIDMQQFVVEAAPAVDRLCELTGQDPAALEPNRILRLDRRQYALRGEEFSVEFTKGRQTAFCPACLVEDEQGRNDPHAHRRGRLIWKFRAVRTCSDHGLPLIERCNMSWDDRYHELPVHVPETGKALIALGDAMERRIPTGLQDYVIGRLNGKSGPAWLDGQGIEQGARATEMVGALVLFGPKQSPRALTTDQWERAAQEGWSFTRRGEEGILEALRTAHDGGRFKSGNAGPQLIFGSFYKWLAYHKNRKDLGPIRDVFREYILNTIAIRPGEEVLGAVVSVRRLHSVHSLAKEFKLHPNTLRTFLIARGVIGDEDANVSDGLLTIEVEQAEELGRIMQSAIPLIKLPKIFNASGPQITALLNTGLLAAIGGEGPRLGVRCHSVAPKDIDRLLARIVEMIPEQEGEKEGFLPLSRAANISRVKLDTILPKLFDGTLKRAGRVAGVPGLGGIRVDMAELAPFAPEPPRGFPHSVALVELNVKAMFGLALLADRPGGALLTSRRLKSTNPRIKKFWLMPEDIAAFRQKYATLPDLSRETVLHAMTIKARLQALGVPTVLPIKELGGNLYMRADLPDGWAQSGTG